MFKKMNLCAVILVSITLFRTDIALPNFQSGQGDIDFTRKTLSLSPGTPDLSKTTADTTQDFDVLYYKLDFNFPLVSNAYSGKVTMRVKSLVPDLNELPIHYGLLEIDSVKLGENLLTWLTSGEDFTIDLNSSFVSGDSFEVNIFFHAKEDKPNYGWFFFERSAYTDSEPSDARYWYPCYDQPWDKAYFDIDITVPDGWEAASNGLLTGKTDNNNGTFTFHWTGKNPMATYLACVTIGDYATWSDWYVTPEQDSIEIMYYTFPEDVEAAKIDFENVPDMMDFYSRTIYPYPFEKYGMASAEPYTIGGMEHQTMTTINRRWISGVKSSELGIAHELIHMWFGDMITMINWPHIWLNESFATYFAALYFEYKYGPDVFKGIMSYYAERVFNKDAEFRYPIFDPPPGYLFGTNEYQKGAWVLHMFRGIVGDDIFWQITRTYAERYAYGNASTQEFIDICTEIYGQDMNWFFDQWLYGTGYPILEFMWEDKKTAGGHEITGTIKQIQSGATIYDFPVTVSLYGPDGEYTQEVFVEGAEQEFTIAYPNGFELQEVRLDPEYRLLKKIFNSYTPAGPVTFHMWQNFPNPFNSGTIIRYRIGRELNFTLDIYSITGKLIRRLRNGIQPAGSYAVRWNGTNGLDKPVASGIYFVRFKAGDFTKIVKMAYTR